MSKITLEDGARYIAQEGKSITVYEARLAALIRAAQKVVDAASSTAPARSDLPTVKAKEPAKDQSKDQSKDKTQRAIPAEDKQRPSEGQVLIRNSSSFFRDMRKVQILALRLL